MSTEYKVKIEDITPDVARSWLATSPRNRRIQWPRVDKYADDMKNGRWSPATMVIIDEDGALVDAHHRMNGVIKANVTVKMVVFYGLEKKYIPYIDTGRPRSAGDMLAFIEGLDGVSSLKDKSTIARLVLQWRAGNTAKLIGYDEIANFILDNVEHVETAHSFYRMLKPIGGTLATGAATFVILQRDPDMELLKDFFEKASSGENLRAGMPEYALRNAIFANYKRGGGGGRQLRDAYYILTAWQDRVSGATRKLFKAPKEITSDLLMSIY